MSVSPTDPSSPGFTRSRLSESERRAQDAEADAQKRIARAEENVRAAQIQTAEKIDEIKDRYVKSSAEQSARLEGQIEEQKTKGYQQIRDLQRAQQTELRKTRMEGEHTQQQLQDYYRDTIYGTSMRGEKELEELKANQFARAEYETRTADADFEATRGEHAQKVGELRENQEAALASMNADARAEYERIRDNTVEAQNQTAKKFQEKFEKTVTDSKETLDAISNRASQKIRDVRWDTSQKLGAYQSRQSDPFYRLMNIDADLSETKDAYVVTATIPEHEQHNVSVSIRGDQIVISGNRRSEEKLESEPGRAQTTSSYQSFSESFPLTWPVDGRKMSRQFDGNQLTVTIPKKATYAARAPYQGPKPERAKVERPKFPENIPHTAPPPRPDPEAPEPTTADLSKKNNGTRTLS